MSIVHIGRIAAGVVVAFGVTALAESAGQAQSQAQATTGEKVTVVGNPTTERRRMPAAAALPGPESGPGTSSC
jgi:hypothetical protein